MLSWIRPARQGARQWSAARTRHGSRYGLRLRFGVFASLAAMVGLLATTAPIANHPYTLERSAPAAAAYRLDPELAVQWHGMWAFYTDEQRERVLSLLQEANIHALRMDVSWAMLQPTNGTTYDPWGVSFLDRVIGMMNAHSM